MAVVIPNAAKAFLVDLLNPSDAQAKLTNIYGAWGSGAGTSVVTDTTLFVEEGEARVITTNSNVTTTVTGDTYQAVFELTASAGKTITNAGIFDASSSGTMLLKGDHPGVVLAASDRIEYTAQIRFTD